MLKKEDLLSLNYYKTGASFTGSEKELRYKITPSLKNENESDHFILYTWYGLYAFDKTPEKEIEKKTFPFSDEGLSEITDFLNSLN